jgi:hypothetical protein
MSVRRRVTTALTALLVSAGIGAVALVNAQEASAATYSGYVMGYFTESPSGTANNYGLHLAVSSDGLNWTPLNQNNPVVTPTQGTGGLRDPFILRKQDGTFEVIATDLKGTDWTQPNQYIHVWDSPDLRTFANYRRLKLHNLNTHSWAPEAFWDASRNQYAIIYSADVGGHGITMVSYTTDFVTATTGQTFFDPGYGVLDATMHSSGGVNYLYFKNTGSNLLVGARSSTLNPGSFSVYTSGVNKGGIEAPIVVQSNTSNTWYLWGDAYSPVNGEFHAWQSSNIGGGSWSLMSKAAYNQPLNSKHATITPITATEQANLVSRWGAPAWNRVKSYNYPDRYVRHYNYAARIDDYPFDPYADQQWKLVPGLADGSGVSFQAVNYPSMYLRQSNNTIVLATNDNSAAFKADATFYKTAGLADSGWTSFRSYSQPTRYIRHYAYVLRLDVLSSGSAAIDRQDATFRIVY